MDKIKKFSFQEPLGQFEPNLAQKLIFVMRTQICSNEGPCPFPREDNYEIEKIHWRNFFKNLLCFNIRVIFFTRKQETQNWLETDSIFYWHNILTIDLSIFLSIVAISSTLAMIFRKSATIAESLVPIFLTLWPCPWSLAYFLKTLTLLLTFQ